MNYSIIRYILCRVLEFQALFLSLPCIASVVYQEKEGWAYAAVLAFCLAVGFVGKLKKPKSTVFYAKEGFVTVSLSWIILSLTGALPLYLSGEFPSYTDALFETISGLTTWSSYCPMWKRFPSAICSGEALPIGLGAWGCWF